MGILGFYALYILRASWASQKYKVGIPPPFYRQGNRFGRVNTFVWNHSVTKIICKLMSVWLQAPYLESLHYHWESSVWNCPNWKIWAVIKTRHQTETQLFVQTLDLSAVSYRRETSVKMYGHQSFLIIQEKNHHYYKHWDWWDFC